MAMQPGAFYVVPLELVSKMVNRCVGAWHARGKK